jgi:peroxiredoxin family protein
VGRRVAILASRGGLEAAYLVMNIATAAAASDAEVVIFFTFDGINIIHKDAANLSQIGPGKDYVLEGMEKANVPKIDELLEIAKESGVKLVACQMTMDVAGISKDDLVDGVEIGGAVTFLDYAYEADVTLTF